MINYNNEYIKSFLSYITYINMDGSRDGDLFWANLINEDLSIEATTNAFKDNAKKYIKNENIQEFKNVLSTLDLFTTSFIIKKQIVTRGLNGFAATTFQLTKLIPGTTFNVGDVFVTYRGTETSVGDYLTDVNLALNANIKWSGSQEGQAEDYLKDAIETYGDVYVCGHSLGGYLGVRSFYYLDDTLFPNKNYSYSDKVLGVSTFNAAGFSTVTTFIDQKPHLISRVNNFYSMRGLSVTTGNIRETLFLSVFEHLGPRYPTFTENAGGIGNHSMALLVTTMGYFAVLQNALDYIPVLKDLEGNVLFDEEAKIYAMNKIMMQAIGDSKDFGLAYNSVASKIIDGFNIAQESTYESQISTFISLREYFLTNQQFKIRLLDNNSTITRVHNNNTRSLMYSLINNISYQLVVPESFNNGIFDKSNENFSDYKLYNIENYTEEYLEFRQMYNKVYVYVLENKLLNSLPFSLEYDLKLKDGTNAKYVFIEQEMSGGNSNVQKKIYVNTNKNEVDNNDVQTVYFKKAYLQQLNVYYKNAIVFDTPVNDSITVFNNNNLIHLMAGYDNITLNNNTEGNVLFIEEKMKEVNINNLSTNPVTIKSTTLNLNEIEVIIKEFYPDASGSKLTKTLLKFGDQKISVSGKFNIAAKDTTIDYEIIQQTIKYFPENFNNAESNTIIFDEAFLEKYIERTKAKFGVLTYEFEKIPTNRSFLRSVESEIKLSQQHSDYILQKITNYSSVLNSLGFTFDASIFNSYITDKVLTVDLDQTILPTSVNNLIMNRINQPQITISEAIKVLINEKLQSFSSDKYLNVIDMSNVANSDSGRVDNIYLKKETKGYKYTTDDNGIVHSAWDGKYYYNKIKNNVQVDTYKYGSTNDNSYDEGKLMYYYNNGVYIDINNLVALPDKGDVTAKYPVSGSDGSDILVGRVVYGQSNNYGAYENATFIPADTNQNGNDIIVADILASVNSGNNLLVSDTCVYGGKGNDFIIFTDKGQNNEYFDYDTHYNENFPVRGVYINHNAKNGEEENSKNYVLSLGGSVFSSKATNFVIDLSNQDSSISVMFATGKDTFFGGKGNPIFIGGYEAYQLAEDQQTPEGDDFYTKHQVNTSKNFVYGGSGNITAYLSQNDFGDFTAGKATVVGLGSNEIILNNDSFFVSGGNSTITIIGKNNHVFLAEGDIYNAENSFENNIYPVGFREQANTEISMTIKGALNTFNLSKATYNLSLEGVNSTVLFTQPNNNIQNININEVGETNLTFNNKIAKVKTYNKAVINGSVEDLEVTYNNDLELYITSKKVKIDTDSTLGDNNNNLVISGTIEDLTITNESDYNTTTFNGSIENALINKTILSGEVTDSHSLNVTGIVAGLKHTGKTNSFDNEVNISGLITDNSTFKNVSSFNYQEVENNDLQSSFTIENSFLNNFIANIYNTDIKLIQSDIQDLILNGLNYQIELQNTNLNTLKVEKADLVSFNTNTQVNNFEFNFDSVICNGTGLNNLSVNYNKAVTNQAIGIYFNSGSSFNVDSTNDKVVELNLSNLTELVLNNGKFNIMGSNIGYAKIDIDKVTIYNFSAFNNFDMECNTSIKISCNGASLIKLNDNLIDKLPSTFTVSGKVYSKADLQTILTKLENYPEAFATCNGIETIYTGLPVTPEEPEVPTNPTAPYYDSQGVYNGTSGNDIFTLNENKEYKLRGRGGDDTYNFIGANNYMNTLEYSSTDGLATINTNWTLRINITLTDIEKQTLKYIPVSDNYGNINSLNIYNNENLILTINNYMNVTFTLITPTGFITKDNIREILLSTYGTDGDDIIEVNNTQANYIYPKKGNDLININAGYDNKIYYFLNDGFKTINSTGNSYTVILDSLMSKNDISYTLSPDNIISVLYSEEKILTLNQSTVFILNFLSTGEQITGQSIINDFTTIRGTSGNDIIEAIAGYSVYTGAGNDVVNVNYLSTEAESLIYYEIGDGYDRIVMSDIENNKVTIKFPTSMTKSNVKFEYDKNNHNNLNIYYRQSSFMQYEKIMTVENYNYLSTGRANIYLGYTGLSYYFDINPQAEQNYQIAIGQTV